MSDIYTVIIQPDNDSIATVALFNSKEDAQDYANKEGRRWYEKDGQIYRMKFLDFSDMDMSDEEVTNEFYREIIHYSYFHGGSVEIVKVRVN